MTSVTLAPQRVLAAQPEDIWASLPPPAQTATTNIIESFCCHAHFLADQEIAARWVNGHEGTLALDLGEAFELERLAIRGMSAIAGGRPMQRGLRTPAVRGQPSTCAAAHGQPGGSGVP
jgi:alkylmercury lyase